VLGKAPSGLKYVAVLVIIYIALVSMLGTGMYSTYLPYWLTGSDLWTVVLVIIILAIVFWFVGGEGKKTEAETKEGETK